MSERENIIMFRNQTWVNHQSWHTFFSLFFIFNFLSFSLDSCHSHIFTCLSKLTHYHSLLLFIVCGSFLCNLDHLYSMHPHCSILHESPQQKIIWHSPLQRCFLNPYFTITYIHSHHDPKSVKLSHKSLGFETRTFIQLYQSMLERKNVTALGNQI